MDKIIYLFYKPSERLPFYCGIGHLGRPHEHFWPCSLERDTLFYNTLRKILLANLMPRIKIVETGLTWLEACDLEKQFILFYGRLDRGIGCLTNHTDGGDGGDCGGFGLGDNHSLDSRIKMTKSQRKTTSKREKIRQGSNEQMRAIENYNLATKEISQKFESRSSVRLFGFDPGCVRHVLVGRQKTHGGYGWRYSK